MSKYLLLIKGRKLGPFEIDQIKRMRARGDCDALTRVAPENSDSWVALDVWLRTLENEQLKTQPAVPPSLVKSELTSNSSGSFPQWPFPVVSLLLLHFLTASLHTFGWLLSRHGSLPRFRESDPPTAKAIGLCLIPFYQLYWFFFVFPRLSARTNEFAVSLNVSRQAPPILGYLVAGFLAVPLAMALMGCGILLWMLFSPAPTDNAKAIFFVYPQFLTLINFVLLIPAWAVTVQSVLNACYARQIGKGSWDT